MPKRIALPSLDNPRIKDVVRLRRHRHRDQRGLFIAEGLREVLRAADSGMEIEELFLCDPLLDEDASASADQRESLGKLVDQTTARCFDVPGNVMAKIAYRDDPQGVLAVVRAKRWSLDDLGNDRDASLLLVAVGTEKPGNLGAMARTALAAGCDGIIAAGALVDGYNPNAIRASTAAVFALPIVEASEQGAIDWLAEHGYRLWAATPHAAADCYAADAQGKLAIVIGPEDAGLSDAWLAAADRHGSRVTIPMAASVVDSLNASNAAAILLFEARRRRAVVPPPADA